MTEPGDAPGAPRAHRLAGATSTYLRAAAEQAIDWHPWGTDPFDLARRSGRPVLLDIGASWCHWCHVMDETTYADAEVARLLGEQFVAVKVDRDEHPEVDRRYQRQVGALTGEGGWPLTAFLTPDGEVFLGGTFFPPTDGHGRPGFRRLLREVARLWKDEPERIAENARHVRDGLRRLRDARPGSGRAPAAFAAAVVAEIRASADPVHGGFGGAPKFPHPTAIALLLHDDFLASDGGSARLAQEALVALADGGMYDQVGGGFHRYSVDAGWHIPHFEKMAVDNAALLGVFADGHQRFGDVRFAEVLRGTLGWVREVLGDPAGGWGASQDADNAPGDDGGYFTWSRAELRDALDPMELRFALRAFGVGTEGQMPHDPDRNVLFRLLPPDDAAAGLELGAAPPAALLEVLRKLKRARDRRPAPQVDRALYADLNGRMITGFARAAPLVGDPGALAEACRAADRWLDRAFRPEQGIGHRLGPSGGEGFGLLEDQVAFAAGLIELAAATTERRYADAAGSLLGLVDREFRGESGLLRDLAPRLYDGPAVGQIGEPAYPLEDTPHLSANSAAALAFLRLGALLHDDNWTEKGRGLLAPLAARLGGAGLFGAGAAVAATLAGVEPITVVIDGNGPEAAALEAAARSTWHPNAFVYRGSPPAPFASTATPTGGSGGARALVCAGTSCDPPVREPAMLRERMRARRPAPPASG
ncbi:MAG TPA: DUF255 domain-containing protein [Thermoplasmata archaeon]|nr:DUF255 domain-containing protein [Thermoplasmata archaeon]